MAPEDVEPQMFSGFPGQVVSRNKWIPSNIQHKRTYMKQRQTHRHREELGGCQGGGREGRTGKVGLADANCDV